MVFHAVTEMIFRQWGLVSVTMVLCCIALMLRALGC